MTTAQEFGDDVDKPTFEQILEMDDEDDASYEFSRGIVFDFLEQAQVTFDKMDDLVKEKDLPGLSNLGHFLKGSSATLGLVHLRDACERIQHYGHKKDATGTEDEPDEEKCLKLIKESLEGAKKSYEVVKDLMHSFYEHLA